MMEILIIVLVILALFGGLGLGIALFQVFVAAFMWILTTLASAIAFLVIIWPITIVFSIVGLAFYVF